MITAKIQYPFDERIEQLFLAESKENKRGHYTLEQQGEFLTFTIHASDATALRAFLTTITKILSVWEISSSNGTT